MKKIIRTIHLYLGLASGLVIAVVCLTGAILVFEKEWVETIYRERYFVAKQKEDARRTLDEIVGYVQKRFPEANINSLKIYRNADRTIEIYYTDKTGQQQIKAKYENPAGKAIDQVCPDASIKQKEKNGGNDTRKKEKRKEVKQLFLDPYSGNIVASVNISNSFFKQVEMLHRRLLLGEVGNQVVKISVVLFVVILLTGIVLWWPKNRNLLRQRLSWKINASWKRINHDWHVVTGFYTSIFLLVIALTGLTFAYKWLGNGIFKITGSSELRPAPPKLDTEKILPFPYERIFRKVKESDPEAAYYQFKFPHEAGEAISVSLLQKERKNENARDVLYFDAAGNLVGRTNFNDLNVGHKFKSIMLPIHKGNLGGLFSKVLAGICALAGFTFPFTGLLLWLNRLKKKRKEKFAKARV